MMSEYPKFFTLIRSFAIVDDLFLFIIPNQMNFLTNSLPFHDSISFNQLLVTITKFSLLKHQHFMPVSFIIL